MYRLKHIYPQSVLQLLYNSLIVPHFTYCLLVWGSKVCDCHKLHLVQKRALRLIASEYIADSEPICNKLKILKVTDMFRMAILKFYYKLKNNILPPCFESLKPVFQEFVITTKLGNQCSIFHTLDTVLQNSYYNIN